MNMLMQSVDKDRRVEQEQEQENKRTRMEEDGSERDNLRKT